MDLLRHPGRTPSISPKEIRVRPGRSLLEVKTAVYLEERTAGTQMTLEPLSHHFLLKISI